MSDAHALAAAIRDLPALHAKRDLQLVRRLGPVGDGDDGALVAHGDEWIVLCGEAILPSFVAAQPRAAGASAVVTNVSDVRAMGGRPLAILDMLVSPDEAHAELVLEGLAWAAELLGVEVVGGHLTIGGAASLSATCTGIARRPLRAAAARPGDVLLAAFCLEGRYMSDDNDFFTLAARPRARAAAHATATRSSRSPRRGCATRRATSRCPARPARCCSCSRPRAAARCSTPTGCRAPTA